MENCNFGCHVKITTITINGFKEKEMTDVNEVLKAKPMLKVHTRAAEKFSRKIPCPRNINDVYSLGVSLQYCIGETFLEMAELTQGSQKNLCTQLALKQLDAKAEMEKLANANLNRLLSFFYNNGGPIILSPVSDDQAKEIQPFFNRIMSNFFDQLDGSVQRTLRDSMDVDELNQVINKILVDMYTTMKKLYQADEMVTAFNQMIKIRENI